MSSTLLKVKIKKKTFLKWTLGWKEKNIMAQQWLGKVFMVCRISFTKLPQRDMEVNDSHPKEL